MFALRPSLAFALRKLCLQGIGYRKEVFGSGDGLPIFYTCPHSSLEMRKEAIDSRLCSTAFVFSDQTTAEGKHEDTIGNE